MYRVYFKKGQEIEKNKAEESKSGRRGGGKQDPKFKTLFKLCPISFFFLLCNMTFFF